jgi:hypothetical protein
MIKHSLTTGITIITVLVCFLLTINVIPNLINPTIASSEGQPGGPRQIPGEDPGCHYQNSQVKVNTNPHCLGLNPPIPDCQTVVELGVQDYPCRTSSSSTPVQNRSG